MARKRLEGQALLDHPLAAAVIEVVRERGYQLASVEEFAERAGIDDGELDRRFADKAAVTLAVFEAVIEDFEAKVGAAFASVPSWPGSLRAAAWEMARWIRDNPEPIWFGMVGVLEAGDMALVRREELFKWCAALVEAGRAVAPDPDSVPHSAPLLAVGAIVEMLRRQQDGTLPGEIAAAVPKMMYGAVRPYLGEEAALAELQMPPPADFGGPAAPRSGGG